VDDSHRSRLPRNVLLLGWISLLNDIASEAIFPLLPSFLIGVLGGTKEHLGLIDGLADTTSSLLKLWSGARSDVAGRRKGFVLFGYGLSAVAKPLMSMAFAPWHLLSLRIVDRVGKGVRTAPRDALIAGAVEPARRGRAFAFNRAMDHLGAAIGPLLAFLFLKVWPNHLRFLFALSSIMAVPIVVILAVGLKEIAAAKTTKPAEPFSFSLTPLNAHFRLYLVTAFIFTLGNSSDGFLLVRASELGVTTAWLPVLWGVFHVAKSGLTQFLGPWIDRVGPRPLIWVGWLIYAATYLAFALAAAAWHAWTLFLVYAVFYALTEPSEKALVAELVADDRRGLAYGWFNLAIGIAALPASLMFGILYQRLGAIAAFGTGAALALVAAILLFGVRRTGRLSAT